MIFFAQCTSALNIINFTKLFAHLPWNGSWHNSFNVLLLNANSRPLVYIRIAHADVGVSEWSARILWLSVTHTTHRASLPNQLKNREPRQRRFVWRTKHQQRTNQPTNLSLSRIVSDSLTLLIMHARAQITAHTHLDTIRPLIITQQQADVYIRGELLSRITISVRLMI